VRDNDDDETSNEGAESQSSTPSIDSKTEAKFPEAPGGGDFDFFAFAFEAR
jgi:hypothetical protein